MKFVNISNVVLVWLLAGTLNIVEDADHIHLVTIRYSNDVHRLTQKDRTLRSEGFQRAEKVYATVFASKDDSEFLSLCKPHFYDLIDQYENASTVRMALPKTDKETLDRLGIDLGNRSVVSDSAVVVNVSGFRSTSPMESSGSPEDDAASDDSLSHLERERALSEGEEEEEENRRRRQEDIAEFAAGSARFQEDYSDGDDEIPQLPPNSTSSASASEDSSLSLTDTDRTILPETEEMRCENDAGFTSRRNALAEIQPESVDSKPESLKYLFKVKKIFKIVKILFHL